jgi:hypothetical protein
VTVFALYSERGLKGRHQGRHRGFRNLFDDPDIFVMLSSGLLDIIDPLRALRRFAIVRGEVLADAITEPVTGGIGEFFSAGAEFQRCVSLCSPHGHATAQSNTSVSPSQAALNLAGMRRSSPLRSPPIVNRASDQPYRAPVCEKNLMSRSAPFCETQTSDSLLTGAAPSVRRRHSPAKSGCWAARMRGKNAQIQRDRVPPFDGFRPLPVASPETQKGRPISRAAFVAYF